MGGLSDGPVRGRPAAPAPDSILPAVPTAPGVLVTRPEPGGAATAAVLRALGYAPVSAPALVLASRPPLRPAAWAGAAAVLVASRAALPALDGVPRTLPLLAVGEATAAAARAAGFALARPAAGTAGDLVRLVAATLDPGAGPLLLASGAGYGAPLAAALRAAGFRVRVRTAYAAAPGPALPPAAAAALREGGVVAALFFSPRSAQCAVAQLRRAGLAATAAGVVALALSPRVAAALAPLPWRRVRVAARPDQESLLARLGPPGSWTGPGPEEAGGRPAGQRPVQERQE